MLQGLLSRFRNKKELSLYCQSPTCASPSIRQDEKVLIMQGEMVHAYRDCAIAHWEAKRKQQGFQRENGLPALSYWDAQKAAQTRPVKYEFNRPATSTNQENNS